MYDDYEAEISNDRIAFHWNKSTVLLYVYQIYYLAAHPYPKKWNKYVTGNLCVEKTLFEHYANVRFSVQTFARNIV